MKKKPASIEIQHDHSVATTQVERVRARVRPDLDTPYFEMKQKQYGVPRCEHDEHGVVLDKHDRRVYCKGCKILIDPFEALVAFAASERRLISVRDDIRKRQEREVYQQAREKERRPFVRKLTNRVAVKHKTLKEEPVIGYVVTLECGHALETSATHYKTLTCTTCQGEAKKAGRALSR